MTDWDKELRKDRAALDRAQQRMEKTIVSANNAGSSYRWIAERVRLNHETVRQITVRAKAEKTPAPPAPEES